MVANQDKLIIDTERVRSVLQQASLTLLVTVVNAVFTAIVLAPVVSHPILLTWVAAIAALSAIRWVARQRILRPALDAGRARFCGAMCILFSLAAGLLWGGGAA